MPFTYDANKLKSKTFVLTLAFGEASKLEILSLLEPSITNIYDVCDQVVKISFDKPEKFLFYLSNIAGIRKVILQICKIVSRNNLLSFDSEACIRDLLRYPKDKFIFGISYCCLEKSAIFELQSKLPDLLLSIIKDAGVKKTKILQSNKTEIFTKEIIRRKMYDFVCYKEGRDNFLGLTVFVSGAIRQQQIKKKPIVFPEISLSPTLARLLINLTGLREKGKILDPFCGTGTILLEALKMGIDCIGVDKNPKHVFITLKNLRQLQKESAVARKTQFSVKLGNAMNLEKYFMKGSINAIVTEPILLPTLRSRPNITEAKRMIEKAKFIYLNSIKSMSKILSYNGRIVIVTPSIITKEGKVIHMDLLSYTIPELKIFQPSTKYHFTYPVEVKGQTTRWIKREIYVFQR